MTFDGAFEAFSNWYNECIEAGIEPEEVVFKMGGMALLTDSELVDRLIVDGDIADHG